MNAEKLKDHNIQPVGLGNNRICPETSPDTDSNACTATYTVDPLQNLQHPEVHGAVHRG